MTVLTSPQPAPPTTVRQGRPPSTRTRNAARRLAGAALRWAAAIVVIYVVGELMSY
jgi:hypothetical protein